MKKQHTRLLCAVLAALMLVSLVPSVSAYTGVSRWAEAEVTAMEELGLIPDSLMDANLSKKISRLDMCRIAVLAYEKLTGRTIPLPGYHPFSDTTDADVEKAWAAGIIKGDGNGKFRPDDDLTRLEFFAIVGQFLNSVEYPVSEEDYADISGFSDAASIPKWGRDYTRLTVGLGIVKGNTDNSLNWNGSTARQEGIVLFYRTYLVVADAFVEVPSEPEETEPEETEPEETEPEETEPEETEPEETEPKETEPEETEPEYTGDFINLSGWAEEAARAMDEMGLIPSEVKASSMTGVITRQNMCKILMRTYKMIMSVTDEELNNTEYPFTDTDDVDVRNAYRLGIVNGKGDGIFSPDDPITRQDFFTMSVRFLNVLGYPYTDNETVNLNRFSDGGQVSGYAQGATRLLVGLDIVKGNTNGTLKPRADIVCQESLVIFYRIYNFVQSWEEPAPDVSKGEEVVEFAEQFLGYPYVYAGKSPSEGFDCSGFVYYVYKNFGYTLYPGATNQWNTLSDRDVLSQEELLPGDLVFFSSNGAVSGMEHVGIYIGDGKFIHAANPTKGVIITDLSDSYYARRYLGGKRVIVD